MHKFYVSLTYDLLGAFLEYEADCEEAVRLYLEEHFLRDGRWKIPWCSVYREAPLGGVVIKPRIGPIYLADYKLVVPE